MANRRLTRSLWSLATVVCLLSASGATCQRQMMVNPFAAPGRPRRKCSWKARLASRSSRPSIRTARDPIAHRHRRVDHDSRHAGPAAAQRQHRGRAAGPVPAHRRHRRHRPGNRPRQQRRVVLDVGAAQSAAGRLLLPAQPIRQQQHPPGDAGRAVVAAGGAGHGRYRSGQRVRRPARRAATARSSCDRGCRRRPARCNA